MANLKKDIGLAVNDLGIYFNGLKVAVGYNDVKDVVRYLNNMKGEIAYALATILPLQERAGEVESVKESIEKDIAGYHSKVQELEGKLKKLK